jgi:hypothetical protein
VARAGLPPAKDLSRRAKRAAGHFPFNEPAKADRAPVLSIPERILLFCVASDTDWEHAGITGTTVTAMRGLIQRDPVGEGRAVLAALLAKGD